MKFVDLIKRKLNYIVVFLIPWIIVVIHSLVRDGWLLGQGSILNGDTGGQLYPMMVALWDKIHNGESLFFSWNAGMGYDFYMNMTYYLISPFNLIVLLLPKAWICNSVQFVMVLKWSLMGVTATYYFMHSKVNTLTDGRRLLSFILGLGYVLSNAILAFFGYFNWSDVLILFPILLLLLEQMIDSGKWKLYYITLSVAMICNFYMAYQVCIFLVLWFLLHWNATSECGWKCLRVFICSSILSGITCMVIILPAVLGVSMRYDESLVGDDIHNMLGKWINSIYDLGEKSFLFNDGIVDWLSFQPNLYYSVGLLVLCLLFFFIRIKKGYKVKTSLIWLFMNVSLCSGALLIFWHGFSLPNGVYHRYLYIYVFLMLYMALEVVQHLDSLKISHIVVMCIAEVSIFVMSFLHVKEYQDFYGYFITFLLVVLYSIVLILFAKRSIKFKHVIVFFGLFIFAELFANAIYEFKEYNIIKWEDKMNNKEASRLVDNIEIETGERVDFIGCMLDFGMYQGIPSTNIFASYCDGDMIHLNQKLGMGFFKNAGYAPTGTSPLINLMFNIRYGIGESEGCFSDVDELTSENEAHLYEMNRLAGLGYMVDSAVIDWDIDTENDYDNQNAFVKHATGVDDVFEVVKPNLTFEDDFLHYKYDELAYERGYYVYDYTSANLAEAEITKLSFTVEEDMDLYAEMFAGIAMKNVICVDGESVYKDKTEFYQESYHFGPVKKGQKVEIYSMHSMPAGEKATLWFRFAKFNEENYAKAYEKLSKNIYQIDEMSSTYVSGTIHAEEDGIMMTSIPAMDGFQVYVDGEETSYESIGGALIGVPLRAGDHKVEFKYMTPYFIPGLIGSVAGIMIFVIICIVDAARKKKSLLDDKVEKMQGET